MSSILDALEKANRKRKAGENSEEESIAEAKSARERRLQAEAEEARRRSRQMGILLFTITTFFVSLMLNLAFIYFRTKENNGNQQITAANPLGENGVGNQDQVVPPNINGNNALSLPNQPTPTPEPVATPTPSPLPTATPVPSPTPTPVPTPQPTPVPTPMPSPVPKPRFVANQVVNPSEVGLEIQGVMEDGANSLILLKDTSLEIGRKYKGIRPLSIRSGLIEIEYDQGEGVIPLFVRY